MASRTPSRGRSSARSARSPSSNSQPLIFGGIGLAVVVVLVVMMNRGGSSETKNGETAPAPAAAKSTAAPAPAPVQLAAAKGGKAPATPAPALTQETLGKVSELTRTMKDLYNEGATARQAGDHAKAREKQAQAKDVLERIDAMLEPALRWQEKAQDGDWAQPSEYTTLERLYGEVMKVANMVRKGGGQ